MDNQVAHTTPRRPHHGGGGGGGGGREDCWSEGATETLIEAWGDRYVQLNRGNLRQKDWKEVADAVNVHRTGIKPPRTDIQCKNRIDTLKKKYKLEKSKPSPSKWPFYYRLNQLIGPNSVTPATKKSNRTSITLIKSKPKPNPKPSSSLYSGGGSSRLNSSGSNESSLGGGAREDDDVGFGGGGGGGSRKHRMDYVDFSEETAYKELARAILRFGEIYERIESSKQQQMMELEKQRMEFTKELEVQRMNMFMDTQLELEKMKRNRKGVSGAGKKL